MRLHTNLYIFGYNISSDISYTENSSGLNLGEGPCIFTSFHFPDSGLYVLTLGRTRKFIPPPWYKVCVGKGEMEPLPGVCDMLQYFETILPVVESC